MNLYGVGNLTLFIKGVCIAYAPVGYSADNYNITLDG